MDTSLYPSVNHSGWKVACIVCHNKFDKSECYIFSNLKARCQKWIESIAENEKEKTEFESLLPTLGPTKRFICRYHFLPSDFFMKSDDRYMLKAEAVPSKVPFVLFASSTEDDGTTSNTDETKMEDSEGESEPRENVYPPVNHSHWTVTCIVCHNKLDRSECITFVKSKKRCQKWMQSIAEDKEEFSALESVLQNLDPTKRFICRYHFLATDFFTNSNGKQNVRKEAVPSKKCFTRVIDADACRKFKPLTYELDSDSDVTEWDDSDDEIEPRGNVYHSVRKLNSRMECIICHNELDKSECVAFAKAQKRCQKWIRSLSENSEEITALESVLENVEPSKRFICRYHFPASDFKVRRDGRIFLKNEAVPSKKCFTPDNSTDDQARRPVKFLMYDLDSESDNTEMEDYAISASPEPRIDLHAEDLMVSAVDGTQSGVKTEVDDFAEDAIQMESNQNVNEVKSEVDDFAEDALQIESKQNSTEITPEVDDSDDDPFDYREFMVEPEPLMQLLKICPVCARECTLTTMIEEAVLKVHRYCPALHVIDPWYSVRQF